MNATKFTKGEWKADGKPHWNENESEFVSIVYAKGTADKPSAIDCDPDDDSPAVVYGKNKEECNANAKLIAAAPEMYDALIFIFHKLQKLSDENPREMFNWYTNGDHKKLHSAIQKASL